MYSINKGFLLFFLNTFHYIWGRKHNLAAFAQEHKKQSEIYSNQNRKQNPIRPKDLCPTPVNEAVNFEKNYKSLKKEKKFHSDSKLFEIQALKKYKIQILQSP